jgi:hypothetical protein
MKQFIIFLATLAGLFVVMTGPAAANDVGKPGAQRTHASTDGLPLAQKAGALAQALGKPRRFLIGLGTVPATEVLARQIRVDIYDQYINGVGTDSWINWNRPPGAYVKVVTDQADALRAVPMFTLYQMAARGDSDLSGLTDRVFMADYWRNVRILYAGLAKYGKPALVNFEPDFWGYTQRIHSDPNRHFVHVRGNKDCADLPDSVVGMATCLVQMARNLAPNAYVGFPPSLFGDLRRTEPDYMQKIGAARADFVVMQTADRDAGCLEAESVPDHCKRPGAGGYWDESNQTTPNFAEHFVLARKYHLALQLPLLWWQTPLGLPAAKPSSQPPWRDNRVRYFLTHPDQLIAAGGMGVVFSSGGPTQTNLQTDKGQFLTLSRAYLARPAALP